MGGLGGPRYPGKNPRCNKHRLGKLRHYPFCNHTEFAHYLYFAGSASASPSGIASRGIYVAAPADNDVRSDLSWNLEVIGGFGVWRGASHSPFTHGMMRALQVVA